MVCEEGNMMHHEVASSDLSEIPERWEGNIVNLEADSPLKDLSISDPPVKADQPANSISQEGQKKKAKLVVVFVDEPGMKATKEANQEGTDAPPPRRSKRISQKQSKLPSSGPQLARESSQLAQDYPPSGMCSILNSFSLISHSEVELGEIFEAVNISLGSTTEKRVQTIRL